MLTCSVCRAVISRGGTSVANWNTSSLIKHLKPHHAKSTMTSPRQRGKRVDRRICHLPTQGIGIGKGKIVRSSFYVVTQEQQLGWRQTKIVLMTSMFLNCFSPQTITKRDCEKLRVTGRRMEAGPVSRVTHSQWAGGERSDPHPSVRFKSDHPESSSMWANWIV